MPKLNVDVLDDAAVIDRLADRMKVLGDVTDGNPFWDLYADRIETSDAVTVGAVTLRDPCRYVRPYELDDPNHPMMQFRQQRRERDPRHYPGIGALERLESVGFFCFPITSPDLIAFIAKHSGGRLIDPIAGTGYLTWVLVQHGVDCLTYDNDIRAFTWGNVRRGDGPRAVARHGRDRALLLSWVPQHGPVGLNLIAAYRGDTIIFTGEFDSCGDEAFHKALDLGWYPYAGMFPVRWGGLKDVVVVYKRRPRIRTPRLADDNHLVVRDTAYRRLLGRGSKFLHTREYALVQAVIDDAEQPPPPQVPHPVIPFRPGAIESPIDWLPSPEVDIYGTTTIGRWGGYLIQIMPMIFNDRVVLTPEASPLFVEYGWCYDKGGAAALAVYAWNPETEAEPAGYKKAVIDGRKPGQQAEGVLW